MRAEFVARGLASRETAQTTGLYYTASDVHTELGQSPFLRELLIPVGHSGYVALLEIENAVTVTILAVRHQLEDDYH